MKHSAWDLCKTLIHRRSSHRLEICLSVLTHKKLNMWARTIRIHICADWFYSLNQFYLRTVIHLDSYANYCYYCIFTYLIVNIDPNNGYVNAWHSCCKELSWTDGRKSIFEILFYDTMKNAYILEKNDHCLLVIHESTNINFSCRFKSNII